MKSSQFNKTVSETFNVPLKTVTTYTRFLKEAGLLTSGARGVNAPHMTDLDAARILIALLAADGPSQAVDRVKRFGKLKYSADFEKNWAHYKNIGTQQFNETFEGETLEEVLTFLLSRYRVLGIDKGIEFFNQNIFHLRVNTFHILAELVKHEIEDNVPVREIVVPFKGEPDDESFPKIKGFIRNTREIVPIQISNFSHILSIEPRVRP